MLYQCLLVNKVTTALFTVWNVSRRTKVLVENLLAAEFAVAVVTFKDRRVDREVEILLTSIYATERRITLFAFVLNGMGRRRKILSQRL